jgi:hypothetical protein
MSLEPKELPYQSQISSRNIPTASAADRSLPIERLVHPPSTIDSSAKGAAALESQLEGLQAERKIERFFWILGVVILADCVMFKFEDAWTSNTFVGLLSLVLLIGCARWLEVPWVYISLVRIFDKIMRDKPSSSNNEPGEET